MATPRDDLMSTAGDYGVRILANPDLAQLE